MKDLFKWVCLVAVCLSALAQGTVIEFADENLKSAIQDELNIWWDPEDDDLRWETSLNLTFENIHDLAGIEAAINLQNLNLRGNHVSDITPLKTLSQLTVLNLSENELSDLSGVGTLTQLRTLDVHGNGVTDLSPLAGMTQLTSLTIRDNQFKNNIAPLKNLTKLEYLDLQENQIQWLNDLQGMTKLKHLHLYYNWISDLSVIARMTQLETLDLRFNLIRDISDLTNLTHLKKLYLQDNRLQAKAYDDLETIKANNPTIDLTYDTQNTAPGSVVASHGTHAGTVRVTWEAVNNGPSYTSYYKVYRALTEEGDKQAVSDWLTQTSFEDDQVQAGLTYVYWVQTALSAQGLDAGEYSGSAQGWIGQAGDAVLSIQAGVGGTVWPEPGLYEVESGSPVEVSTVAWDANAFEFVTWAGSAVEHGKVADPNQAVTTVVLDANETLTAMYQSTLARLIVDANAIVDANQQGTELWPMATIQDAIRVASEGTVISVRPGVHVGPVDFMGKAVQVIGCDPNQIDPNAYPMIVGSDDGAAVRFQQGETPDTLLMGFTICNAQGGILCDQSSPSLSHCVVAGIRTSDPNLAPVTLKQSQAYLDHVTITDNLCGIYGAGLVLDGSDCVITNSIVWGNIPRTVLVKNEDASAISYCDIQGGWGDSDQGNVNVSPVFVSTGAWHVPEDDPNMLLFLPGDYHLQSQAGHWDDISQEWIVDLQTSACIDQGIPDVFIREPQPHGNRINLGAYGNSTQASKTP